MMVAASVSAQMEAQIQDQDQDRPVQVHSVLTFQYSANLTYYGNVFLLSAVADTSAFFDRTSLSITWINGLYGVKFDSYGSRS